MWGDKVVQMFIEASRCLDGWRNGGVIPGFIIINNLVK
jgi:hypothetical protein